MPEVISISPSMMRSSFVVILLSDLVHSLSDEVADVDVAARGDGGDLHDFGSGNGLGVGREDFKDTFDGGLGTSAKIYGLQLEGAFFTPSEYMAQARTVAVVVPSPTTSLAY